MSMRNHSLTIVTSPYVWGAVVLSFFAYQIELVRLSYTADSLFIPLAVSSGWSEGYQWRQEWGDLDLGQVVQLGVSAKDDSLFKKDDARLVIILRTSGGIREYELDESDFRESNELSSRGIDTCYMMKADSSSGIYRALSSCEQLTISFEYYPEKEKVVTLWGRVRMERGE